MRTREAPSAAQPRAIQPRASSRRRGRARNVLIPSTAVLMGNYLCGNELVERSGLGQHQERAQRGGMWLARSATGVADPQLAIGTNTICGAQPTIYTTFGRARHVLYSPAGYEQGCVLGSLVLRLGPAMGPAHRLASVGLHPS